MPTNEDRILQILRSLKPVDASRPAAPPAAPAPAHEDAPGAGRTDGGPTESGGDEPVRRAPWSPAPEPRAARGESFGRVELRLEEVGFFFLAAVVLVVLAFLMGWYGRGLSGAAERAAGESTEAAGGVPRVNILPMGTTAARDLGMREGSVRQVSTLEPDTFSILVVRFPPGGEAEAEDHRTFLEQNGYTPSWIRRTTAGVELCVGRFGSPTDVLAKEWLPKVRRLHGSYASSTIVRIPRE